MSTDATHPTARLIVTEPATSRPAHSPPRPIPLVPERLPHTARWRDPSRPDMFRSTLAAGASAMALAVMVLSSLLLVSLASAHAGILVPGTIGPDSRTGLYPTWLSGPTGVLTSWFPASHHTERVIFTAAIATMLVAYLVVVYAASRVRPTWVLTAIVALHVVFLLSPPFILTDVFNYLNYGRMDFVHHLNPYTTIPALEPHGDPTFLLSNWHGLLNPYGPLFTLFTIGLAPIGVAGSFWAMKVALMLASLGTLFLVYRCAQLLGRNPVVAVAILGLNPIVLVWGLGGDHNDFLMLFLILLACWLLLAANAARVGRRARPAVFEPGVGGWARRVWARLDGMPRPLVEGEPGPWMEIAAGVALVAAVTIKASSAILIPVIVCGTARRMRVVVGLLIGFAAATAMTLYAFGSNLPNLGQQSRLVIPDGIPNLIGLGLGFGGETAQMRTVMSLLLVVVVAGCSVWAWRTRRWLVPCGWASFALVVTLSWTLPWYIVWLLPFVALGSSRGLRFAAVLLGIYIYLAWIPYSAEVLGFLNINPATTTLGQQESSLMNSLLF